jgi:hypothetical protein
MRKLTTAITAAALAFSMVAAAVPAAAITGYDSAYAGESAFVNITAGQTQNFQVFFANTGTTSWVKSTGTQVDLAACLEDKVTCNAQDASEATWNSGWLSATRYATTTQTTTPPGSLGTFSYNITAPTGVAAGIYHFNGDVVLASTGEKLHPEGYFQDANTGGSAGAPTITLLTPNNGPSNTTVVITGTGFLCQPAFPTVSFGGTNAVVSSCGATSITVKSPTHALGAVTVTASNTGSGPSNGLTYTYTDITGPNFISMTVSGDTMTATFDEPVCKPAASNTTAADWTVQNVSAGPTDYAAALSTDNIPTDCTKAVSTISIFLDSAIPNGAFVEATLNDVGASATDLLNEHITDASGNASTAPQSRQATATAPETTKPTFVSASGAVGQPNITLTFSEPIYCDSNVAPSTVDFTIDDQSTTTDPTVLAVGDVNACGFGRTTADTSFNLKISANLKPDVTYTVTINSGAASEIQDVVGNTLTVPTSVTFTSGAGDFTPPTLVDSRVANNLGTTDWGYSTLGVTESGDSFTTTFSEVMNGTASTAATAGSNIQIQDQDGTVLILTCGTTVTCLWNATVTTLTVTTTGTALTPAPSTAIGTTPGMQIPFNITSMNGFTDVQGNVPNVLGSADRLVDYE